MPTHRRERVLRLYYLALARDASGRDALLTEACAGDDGLRRDVEALLAEDPPSGFLGVVEYAGVALSSVDALLIGRRLGVYRVDAKLGAGGMGEVFRAHDTKLGRDVAIKVLPALVGRDPERLARFEREARILATLNHPHIASIYGVEDADGLPALVLELVEGETLAERLARSHAIGHAGMPIAEALAVARQIAAALDAAHDKGIVHRDLKPANVKFAADGSVKVLDFGLAKAMADSDSSATPVSDGTETGMVLGTVPYMSPEQARGERVDTRTDIWGFGCVLYEMLTGRAVFGRATAADTVAAVLQQEPDWTALPAATTPAIRLLLERCLQKNSRARLRDIGGVPLAMADAPFSNGSPPVAPPAAAAATRRSVWRRAGPALASLLLGAVLVGLALRRGAPEARPEVTRLSITARGAAAALYVSGNDRQLAITPDGSQVVYVGDDGRQLFVRALNQLEPVAIASGSLLKNPFVSPDGRWVGYGEGVGAPGQPNPLAIKKVPIGGGPAFTIATIDGALRGAAWLADDTVVFGTEGRLTGLQRVSARGGTAQTLSTPDASSNGYDHFWPSALPDGRGILYTVLTRTGGIERARIAVHDLQTNTSTDLLTGGSNAVYHSSGHLVYVAGGTLWAIPFDVGRRAAVGAAVPVVKQVDATGGGGGNFAISATGTLVYAHTSGYDPFARSLSWVDRTGTLEPLAAPQHPYGQIRLSHDGTRVAHATGRGPENNIWVLDVSRGLLTPQRREAAREQDPWWSPDDRWIYFASNRGGTQLLQIWRQAADGTGEPELLVDRGSFPTATPDGRHLVFIGFEPASRSDIMRMALDGSRRISPLVQTRFNEQGASVSPDSRWLAYQSDMSGRMEVYVSSYPDATTGRWQVSTGGGGRALWARNGRELFFVASDRTLMGVEVKATGQTWSATAPVKIVDAGYWSSGALIGRQYDVSLDGKRFLIVTPRREVADPPELVVIQHWDQELEAGVAAK